jgi:hypothetical protein
MRFRIFGFMLGLTLTFNVQAFGISKPIKDLTTGDILTSDIETICVSNYSKTVRDVSGSTKKKVYDLYKVPANERGTYKGQLISKIDHLVPLAIGGSNDISNLWSHYYYPEDGYGVVMKNRIENKLHRLVCEGKLDIKEAQNCIASDWQMCYDRFVR